MVPNTVVVVTIDGGDTGARGRCAIGSEGENNEVLGTPPDEEDGVASDLPPRIVLLCIGKGRLFGR